MIVQNKRPGVYSSYEVTSGYTSPLSQKYAAVIAKAQGGEVGKLYSFNSYSEACGVFMPDCDGVFMRALLRVLFDSGVSAVLAVPVGDSYEAAFDMLKTAENIGAVVCDTTDISNLQGLANLVRGNALNRRECMAFCGISDPAAAMSAARAVNCERVVITCPSAEAKNGGEKAAAIAAAALAGKILASGDAAANFNGDNFPVLSSVDTMSEETIQSLLEAGVTVFENVSGQVECVRTLTTRTTTGGATDRSLAGINTVLIIDDVMQYIRATLKLRLSGGRIGGASSESIRSQVAVALVAKQSDGLIESFEIPRCYPSTDDPDVCVVELSFKVAHVVAQIHVTAHIQA